MPSKSSLPTVIYPRIMIWTKMKLSQRQLSNNQYNRFRKSNFNCETPGRQAPIGYRHRAQKVPPAKIIYKLHWHQSYSKKMAQDLQWKYSRIKTKANRKALNYHLSKKSISKKKYSKYWNGTEAAYLTVKETEWLQIQINRKLKPISQNLRNARPQTR